MNDRQPQIGRETFLLTKLALPIALAQLGSHLMGVVDIAVVGRYSESALAAVGLGTSIYFGIGVLGMGVMWGLDPIISQAVGAKQTAEADTAFWQGMWLATILVLPIILLLVGATWLLKQSPIEQDVVRQATAYIHARMFAAWPFYVVIGLRSFLQAYDVTRPFLIAVLIANVVNIPLSILFVFGDTVLGDLGLSAVSVPSMGAAGAGWATLLAASLQALILGAFALSHRPTLLRVPRRFNAAIVMRAMRVGIPIALTLFAEVAFFSVTGILAGWLGASALAAHNVALNLAGTTFQVAIALGTAASVRVGQAIGANDTPRARRAGLIALGLASTWMTLGAILFVSLPTELISLITTNPDVLDTAYPLMLAAAAFQIVDGAQAVMNGALRGAGDTRFAFLANAAGHYLLGLPFALVAAFVLDWGARGLWWGLCIGLASVSLILTLRFLHLSQRDIHPI